MSIPKRFKAFELDGPGQVKEVVRTFDGLASDQVLLRPVANAFCSGDVARWRGDDTPTGPIGHEPAGEIVAVGSDVHRFAPGMFAAGQVLAGDALAEFTVVAERTLRSIAPENIRNGTLMEPTMCTALSARRAKLAGAHVVFVGLGAMATYLIEQIALMPVVAPSLGFAAARPASITVLVNRPYHEAEAMALPGVTHALCTAGMDDAEIEARLVAAVPELAETRKRVFEGAGSWMGEHAGVADVVFEMAGNQRSLDTAVRLVRAEGELHVVAYHQGGKGVRTINQKVQNLKGITVLNDHWRLPQTVDHGLDLAAAMFDHGLDVSRTITDPHPFTRAGIEEALRVADARADFFMKSAVLLDA